MVKAQGGPGVWLRRIFMVSAGEVEGYRGAVDAFLSSLACRSPQRDHPPPESRVPALLNGDRNPTNDQRVGHRHGRKVNARLHVYDLVFLYPLV